MSLVRELLQTTNAGKQLLTGVGNDNCRLERTLYVVSDILQEQMVKVAEQKKFNAEKKDSSMRAKIIENKVNFPILITKIVLKYYVL